MTFKLFNPASAAVVLLVFALGVLPSQRAEATIINYTFTGVTGDDGYFDDGTDEFGILAGTAYSITGMTLDDTDLFGTAGLGMYAAMSTYTFFTGAGALTFTTDATTGEGYLQLDAGSFGCGASSCVGLVGVPGGPFGLIQELGSIIGGADAGAIAYGGPVATGAIYTSRTIGNSLGQELFFIGGECTVSDPTAAGFCTASATAKQSVPEPATLALLGLGLFGLGFGKRRKIG